MNSPLQTNYKDLAIRYELAERAVWSKLPNWKKDAIIKCKLTGTSDHILDEYGHEIAELAESEKVLTDKLPTVPSFTLNGNQTLEPLTN